MSRTNQRRSAARQQERRPLLRVGRPLIEVLNEDGGGSRKVRHVRVELEIETYGGDDWHLASIYNALRTQLLGHAPANGIRIAQIHAIHDVKGAPAPAPKEPRTRERVILLDKPEPKKRREKKCRKRSSR